MGSNQRDIAKTPSKEKKNSLFGKIEIGWGIKMRSIGNLVFIFGINKEQVNLT